MKRIFDSPWTFVAILLACIATVAIWGCTWHGPCVHYHAAGKTWTIDAGTIEPTPSTQPADDRQTPDEIIEELLGDMP